MGRAGFVVGGGTGGAADGVEGEVGEVVGEGGQGGEVDYLVLELFLHAFDGGCLGEEQVFQGEEVFFVDAFVDLLLDEVAECI